MKHPDVASVHWIGWFKQIQEIVILETRDAAILFNAEALAVGQSKKIANYFQITTVFNAFQISSRSFNFLLE